METPVENMKVRTLIWSLLKLYFKHGNMPVKTWVQYEGFCDMYYPRFNSYYDIIEVC